MTLVREFAANQSETAFAALVERHIALVHSAALRQVGDVHLAEEITQAVFIILARKAASLGTKTILSAWLYRTARYAAADALRARRRRQAREQLAYQLDAMNTDDLSRRSETEADAWAQLAPLLDDALAELGETDRAALVLRFFENKTAREIAGALRMEEAAAQKRVARALAKLRAIFVKRGVALTATVIAGAVAANSVQAAPAGLAVTITAAAAKGASISATITTLVKGTMKTMTWLKIKFAIGVGAVALLAGGVATVAISQTSSNDKLPPTEIAKKALNNYALLTSYSDNGKYTSVRNGKTNIVTTFKIQLGRTNLYRIEFEQTMFPAVPTRGAVWSAGEGDFAMFGENDFGRQGKSEKLPDMKTTLQRAALAGWGAANAFFNLGGSLKVLASGGRIAVERQSDEKIGGVDCYVITGTQNNLTRKVWIGKHDFLLHQNETVQKAPMRMAADNATLDKEFEREAKDLLAKMNRDATPAAIAAKKAEIWQAMKEANSSMIIQTETHENIVVNQKFSPADFAR